MRKWNNILARVIIILFLLHAVMGSLLLLGFSTVSVVWISWSLLAAVILHGIFGMLSTIVALKSGKKSNGWYFRQNASFWSKRFSGLAILALLFFHITAYTTTVDEKIFLKEFTGCRLLSQLLLILAVFVHLAGSIRSMLIARGTIKLKEKTFDWILGLSVLTLFFAVSVIAYYIQWQV